MDLETLRWVEAVVDHAIENLRYLRDDPVESGIWLDIVTNWANPVGSKSVHRENIRRVLPGLLAQRGYRQAEGPHNSRVWTKTPESKRPVSDHQLRV